MYFNYYEILFGILNLYPRFQRFGISYAVLFCGGPLGLYSINLMWPDPLLVQGCHRLQYKRLAQKESGLVHRLDWNQDHHRGGGC